MKPSIDIEKETESFLHLLEHVRGYSRLSVTTYRIALQQMAEHLKVEKEEGVHVFNLMPFRHSIAQQNKKTISKKLSAIRSFKEYLEDKGYTVKLVGDSSIKVPKTLPKPISHSHIKEALEQCDMEEKLIVMLLYTLGLRFSELASLKLEDIGDEWVRVLGKGSKMRDIPLLPEVMQLIREYKEQYAPQSFLFEKEGRKLSEHSLRYKLYQVFRRIGIKATPHQLRHAYATDLLNNGARILDVKELLGHSSLVTTEIYTKLNNSLKLKNYLSSHPMCKDSHEDS